MTSDQAHKLTPQHESFIAEYIINGGDGTAAAIAAGYAHSNARFQASRLLARANISQQIEQRKAKLAVQVDYSIADWRRELTGYIADAHAAGSHSAVFKGMELLGRHIGALNDRSSFGAEELKAFAWLGAAMQKVQDSSSGAQVQALEGLPVRELADSQQASMQDS